MSLASELAAYSAQVNADVSSQTDPNSIDPTTVGSIGIDLANIIEPYISVANNQTIYEGTSDPTTLPSFGADLDLFYYKQASFFALYRKESGTWTVKTTVPFGVVLPDGPATIRTFISTTNVTVTPGGWFISNVVYNKATQTLFAIPAADLNFYRTDLVYADTSNTISYLTGTPALTPIDPTLPANTIAVDYVIVPSTSSGFEPYLRYGGSGVNNIGPDDVILNQSATPQVASFNILGSAAIGGTVAMTGLPVNATTDFNVTIDGSGNIRKSNTPVGTGLFAQADTGALTYAGISVVDASHVDIGACTGYIVDNETTPGSPSLVQINYAGELNKLVTTVGSGLATYVLLNSLGVIVFQNTFPTSAQRKTHIYLSKISHPFGAITVAGDEVDFILSPLMQHRDLFQSIGYVNNGVVPSSNGATLNFKTSTGVVTGDGINFVLDNTNPNDLTVAAQTPCVFLPRTQNGSGGGATSTVDVGNYDVAGVVTAIPGGGNVSTNRYIFLVPGLGYIVQYGQVAYANITDATAAVGKEAFVVYPSLVRNAIMVGVLSARKGATDLSNTADGRFFASDKFGQLIGAQAGISLSTLQTAYGNSLQPQIVTTASLGAVQFKRGSAADTDNVLQVLNGAGTAQFSITGNGLTTITSGAEAFKVGTNTGNPDHVLLGLYPRTATPTTRGGYLGWINIASTELELKNELAAGGIGLTTTGASNEVIARAVTFRVTPNTLAVQNWLIVAGYNASSSNNRLTLESGLDTVTGGSDLRGASYRGTSGTRTALLSGDKLVSFTGLGNNTASTQPTAAQIICNASENWSSTAIGTRFSFNNAANTTTTLREVARIDHDGVLMLQNGGTYTNDGVNRLQVNGSGIFKGGAEALKVSTATGNPDHAYMVFYARTASPSQQSGMIGFNGVGTANLSVLGYQSGGSLILGNEVTAGAQLFNTTRNLVLQNGGTFTDNATDRLQVSGSGRFNGGAEALKVSTATGNPDHAYMGFYARTASPTTRSARIGYTSVAATTFNIVNDLSGGSMVFGTTGASNLTNQTNMVQLSVTDSGSAEVARISQGTTASSTASNIIWMQSCLGTHSTGSEIRLNNGGGTFSSQTAIASGGNLGLIQFGGNTTTSMGSAYNSVAIKAVSTELFAAGSGGSKLNFYTTPNTTIAQQLALTIDQDQTVIAGGKVRLKNYTVATLPAGVQGDTAYVTDALAPTYNAVAVGGGAIVIRVFYNGTNWVT